MKRIVRVLCALLSTGVAVAQGTLQFVPGGLANVEGNSSSMSPFGLGGSRYQQVFSASEFAFLGSSTGRIDSVWFRLDGNAGADMLANYPGLAIRMTTSSRSPDNLSAVFDDNIGSDLLNVYGANSIILTPYTPSLQPQPFLIQFQFSAPFYYAPSRGNLLMDIQTSGGMFTPMPLDGHSLPNDFTSRVFANAGLATSGTLDSFGLATRFDIAVPEPSARAIFLLFTVLVAICWRQKRGVR